MSDTFLANRVLAAKSHRDAAAAALLAAREAFELAEHELKATSTSYDEAESALSYYRAQQAEEPAERDVR